jgi:predicted nucleotide-binding protein
VSDDRKPKVWCVDLPRNLERFAANHREHFDITPFSRTSEVLKLIQQGQRPDALLCDVFFYDSVEEAERVEDDIAKLAQDLKGAAAKWRANDPERAKGIKLMQQIYEHNGNHPPRFPMYAYTSKGPFLLEREDWENISKYGAQVLLKNRLTPEAEREEIEGDIAIQGRRSRTVFIGHGRSSQWKKLASFIKGELQLEYEEFNRASSAGVATKERLIEMLDRCGLALLVLTGEDVRVGPWTRFGHLRRFFTPRTMHARENVVHELGLFQGRLGWRRAIPLLEEGCEKFSNILGDGHIPFHKGSIKSCFPEVRRVLEREDIVDTSAIPPRSET